MPDKSPLSFTSPPLVEVAFSIQFRQLDKFHLALIGVVWDELKNDYPHVGYEPKLDHQVEKFGLNFNAGEIPNFKFLQKPDIPRVTFSDNQGEYLIQIQNDRFVLNWRKNANNIYPRHELLSSRLFEEFTRFRNVLAKHDIDEFIPDQLEITNVNHIEVTSEPIGLVLNEVLDNKVFSKNPVEGFSTNVYQKLKYKEKVSGRIYTNLEKTKRRTDLKDVYVVKITARSHPDGQDDDSMKGLFSFLRESINEVFQSITTDNYHIKWGKE